MDRAVEMEGPSCQKNRADTNAFHQTQLSLSGLILSSQLVV